MMLFFELSTIATSPRAATCYMTPLKCYPHTNKAQIHALHLASTLQLFAGLYMQYDL